VPVEVDHVVMEVTMERCGGLVLFLEVKRQAFVTPAALELRVPPCELLFATRPNFFVSSPRPLVASNHDSACAGSRHCPTSRHLYTPHTPIQQTLHTTPTHERIGHGLGATMSTVARGGTRGGRGRGAGTGVWRGSNPRGGLNGAPSDSSDRPAFGAKKRGGGAPNGGKARSNAQELDEDGKPKE
jgi:hypothetical protein